MNLLHAGNLGGLCLLIALCVLALAVLGMRADSLWIRRSQAGHEAARRQWTRILADAAFDGLLIHRQGVVLQMNRALARLLGTREREWLGQQFAKLARDDQVVALRAELEAPGLEIVEFCLLRANTGEVAVELCSANIDFEGQPATVTAIRDIRQRQADAARIARLTDYDPLTGLANRKRFGELLAEALAQTDRKSGTTALMILDIDQFKPMNELLGRAGGDLLLHQVGLRISGMIGKEDVLARLGGDKFALIVPSFGAANRALSLGGQIAASFQEPFIIDGQLVKLAISVGIAVYPEHAADAEGLQQASAFAVAQAERAGGASAHMFSHHEVVLSRQAARAPVLRAAQSDVQRLGDDLRQALGRGEIQMVYQPVFRLSDLAPVGFEALARWNHPREGLIGPDRFIPVAELVGLTQEIGCFVLERACAEAVQAGGARMAVNLSAGQLRDVNLAARIGAILRKTGLAPGLLEIELAEGLLAENQAGGVQALQGVQAIGVGVALDNFGSGHLSPNLLSGLALSRLKIDRRFVQKLGQDANADAIVTAILDLAANLRLEVTAVGVETEAQLEILRRAGCQCALGNLLGPPMARALAQPPALAGGLGPARPALVVSRG